MLRHHYYLLLTTCCLLLNAASAFAQIGSSNSLRLSDSLHAWTITTDEPHSYNYVDIENLTGNKLDLDYRVLLPASIPSAWQVEIEYPYLGAYTDTLQGSFRILNDNSGPRQVFVALLPNGQTGLDTLTLRLYPQNAPADSVEVLFIINVLAPVALWEQAPASKSSIYPNPTGGSKIYWTGTQLSPALAYIYSAQGQNLAVLPIEAGTIELPNSLPAAAYWIQIRDSRTLQIIDTQPFIRL